MKKYFEYKFNDEIENKLRDFYENINLSQHNENHTLKSDLKLKRILDIISFYKDDYVLDVGCSRGHTLKKLAQKIKKGQGVDISKNIIEENKKNNNFSNISFELFDGKTLNLNDKYNKILLLDVLEHSFSPDQLISTLKYRLSENGLLIIEVPFTGWISELIFGKYHQGHLRYYDPKYLLDYIKKFNFEVVNMKIFNSVPWSSKIIKISFLFKIFDFVANLVPSKIYPYYGEIILVCKNI